MSKEKPVWLLDIDGVINACVPNNTSPSAVAPYRMYSPVSWRNTWVQGGGGSFPIWWSTEVVDFINEVSEVVDIRWHTTWQEHSYKLADALGINWLPISELGETTQHTMGGFISDYPWWKMEAAVNVLKVEKRPLIWTDDDLLPQFVAQVICETRPDFDDLMLVQPVTSQGLHARDLDAIYTFVVEHIADTEEEGTTKESFLTPEAYGGSQVRL